MKFFKKKTKQTNNKQFLIEFLMDIQTKLHENNLDSKEMEHLLQFWLQSKLKDHEFDTNNIPYLTLLGWYVDQHMEK